MSTRSADPPEARPARTRSGGYHRAYAGASELEASGGIAGPGTEQHLGPRLRGPHLVLERRRDPVLRLDSGRGARQGDARLVADAIPGAARTNPRHSEE